MSGIVSDKPCIWNDWNDIRVVWNNSIDFVRNIRYNILNSILTGGISL